MRKSSDGAGMTHGVALGPDLGQCCGGHVTLLIEAFSASDLAWITPLAGAEATGPLLTSAEQDARGVFRRVMAQGIAEAGLPLREGGTLHERFGEAYTPLLLFGAGHVGRALVLALAPLPVETRWIDPRRGEFPDAFPPNVTPVAPDDPVKEIASAPAGAMLLAMTHSHALDLALVAAGLRHPAIREVGVIGSRTKRARFSSQLRQAGYDEEEIGRMQCPVGVGSLRSKAPAIIALGVAMQIMEWREAAQKHGAQPTTISSAENSLAEKENSLADKMGS